MNPVGSGIALGEISAMSRTSGLEVLIEDTSFTNHLVPKENCNLQSGSGFSVIHVDLLRHLKVINCTFDSTLYFGGHVIFSGNSENLEEL